jgi:hypothetical protein
MAQAASRRQRTAFRIALRPGGRSRQLRHRTKLTPAIVAELRTWAARDGFGLPRKVQAAALARRYPHVAAGTIVDVLDNESWHDPAYAPGAPDAAWLRTWPIVGLVLTVLRT